MSRTSIGIAELQRLREYCRAVDMIEVLCGEPFLTITLHSYGASIPGEEHLITIMGSLPAPERHQGEDLEEYDADYYGRSLVECLSQAVAAKEARDE